MQNLEMLDTVILSVHQEEMYCLYAIAATHVVLCFASSKVFLTLYPYCPMYHMDASEKTKT